MVGRGYNRGAVTVVEGEVLTLISLMLVHELYHLDQTLKIQLTVHKILVTLSKIFLLILVRHILLNGPHKMLHPQISRFPTLVHLLILGFLIPAHQIT